MQRLMSLVCLVLLSNIIFGCSTLPPSTNEMWKRANYSEKSDVKKAHSTGNKKRRVETLYVDSMLLPSGDYLKEAIVQIVIEESDYIFEDPNLRGM